MEVNKKDRIQYRFISHVALNRRSENGFECYWRETVAVVPARKSIRQP
jgi:hypothetical protein